MVDGSALPLAENLALTKAVAHMANVCGVVVEGELGYVPGEEGEDAEKHPGDVIYTTPAEANGFVKRTGVDCLVVSVGSVHGRLPERPRLDFRRLAAIAEAVDIPLVIHHGEFVLAASLCSYVIRAGTSEILDCSSLLWITA